MRSINSIVLCSVFLLGSPMYACCQSTRAREIKALDSQIERLGSDKKYLQQQMEDRQKQLHQAIDLHTHIAKLTAEAQGLNSTLAERQGLIEHLGLWTKAKFVLGNNRTSKALAIAETKDGYAIVAAATHPFQQYALTAATQAAVPCYGTAECETLVAELDRELRIAQELPLQVPVSIAAKLAKLAHLPEPVMDTVKYMVFHDYVTGQQKLGVIEQSPNGPVIRTIDHTIQAVARKAFLGGSVWIGGQEDIEPHIEIGTPFIDYSVLGMIQTLKSDRHRRDNLALAIKVKLDSIGQVTLESASRGKKKDAVQAKIERDKMEVLYSQARHLQDEFYERLTRHQVPVVEREHIGEVIEEDLRFKEDSTEQPFARASHTLLIDVDHSGNDVKRVSVRLVDNTSGMDVWAANNSRSITPNPNWRNYIVQSGSAVVVGFVDKNLEKRVVDELQSESSAASSRSEKRILIEEGRDEDSVQLRSFYGTKVVDVPLSGITLLPLPTTGGAKLNNDNDDSYTRQLPAYAAYRFARRLAIPAVKVQTGDSTAPRRFTLALGSSDRIVTGDRFRLVFPGIKSDALPTFPSVGVIADVSGGSTSELLLPGDSTLPLPEFQEATAVCDSWKPNRVAVMPLLVKVDPAGWVAQKVVAKALGYKFGDQVQNALLQNLPKNVDSTPGKWEILRNKTEQPFWDEFVDEAKTVAELHKRGVTHVLAGKVHVLGRNRFEVVYGLQQIEQSPTGDIVAGEVIDSVKFSMKSASSGI